MNQKKVEQQSLIFTTCMNVIFAIAGLIIFIITDIQALFLDFFFSFIALLSTISAVIISKYSKKKTKKHPDGMWFLEPSYAIFKAILTLSLMIFSIVSTFLVAYKYFSTGVGTPLNYGPAIPYSVIISMLCFTSGFVNRYQNKRIGNISTMLSAESKTNFIDGIQSLGIGVAIVLLSLLDINGPLGFIHYTGDFFITTFIALISVYQPIKILISSLKELKGALVKDTKTINVVKIVLDKNISYSNFEIRKTGMFFEIKVFMNESNFDIINNKNIDTQIEKEIKKSFQNFKINYVKIKNGS